MEQPVLLSEEQQLNAQLNAKVFKLLKHSITLSTEDATHIATVNQHALARVTSTYDRAVAERMFTASLYSLNSHLLQRKLVSTQLNLESALDTDALLRGENELLTSELQRTANALQECHIKLLELEQLRLQQDKQLKALQQQRDNLLGKEKGLQQQLQSVEQDLHGAKQQLTHTNEQLAEVQGVLAALQQTHHNAAAAHTAALQKAQKEHAAEKKAWEEQLSDVQEQLRRAEARSEMDQQDMKLLQGRLNLLCTTDAQAKDLLEKKGEEAKVVANELVALREQLAQERLKRSDVEGQLLDQQHQLAQLRSSNEQQQKQLAQMGDLQREVEQLQGQCKQLQQQKSREVAQAMETVGALLSQMPSDASDGEHNAKPRAKRLRTTAASKPTSTKAASQEQVAAQGSAPETARAAAKEPAEKARSKGRKSSLSQQQDATQRETVAMDTDCGMQGPQGPQGPSQSPSQSGKRATAANRATGAPKEGAPAVEKQKETGKRRKREDADGATDQPKNGEKEQQERRKRHKHGAETQPAVVGTQEGGKTTQLSSKGAEQKKTQHEQVLASQNETGANGRPRRQAKSDVPYWMAGTSIAAADEPSAAAAKATSPESEAATEPDSGKKQAKKSPVKAAARKEKEPAKALAAKGKRAGKSADAVQTEKGPKSPTEGIISPDAGGRTRSVRKVAQKSENDMPSQEQFTQDVIPDTQPEPAVPKSEPKAQVKGKGAKAAKHVTDEAPRNPLTAINTRVVMAAAHAAKGTASSDGQDSQQGPGKRKLANSKLSTYSQDVVKVPQALLFGNQFSLPQLATKSTASQPLMR